MITAKRDKIAPISIFYILYISRIVVSLTNIQAVSSGKLKTDILISIAASMGLTLTAALPALYCCKYNKNPFDIKWVGLFYAAYFIFLAGINISRFAYFASTTLNPNASASLFCVLVTVCAFYGAYLGIEGISRFSAFSFLLLIAAVFAVLILNVKNYEEINLYPVIVNETGDILKNILYITSNSFEVIILLCLKNKINGSAVKPYVFSVTAAFLTIFLLILIILAVMGDSASIQAYPTFSLFQLAKIGMFEKLDILHMSFWILGVFVKSVILIYCAGISFKGGKKNIKFILCAALTMVVSIIFSNSVSSGTMPLPVYLVPYCVFCVAVPLLSLIFKKRNLGDELIEKF